jgi:hypothetical protein
VDSRAKNAKPHLVIQSGHTTMSAEAWTAIATGVGVVVTLGGCFFRWMRRVERAVIKASELPAAMNVLKADVMKAIEDLRCEKERAHEAIWRRLGENSADIVKHGERLAALEARRRR